MNNLTKGHFGYQRRSAKQRNIDFELTYEEWLEIWMSSGFAHLRGKGTGTYCMARHNDIGPYAVGNVSIISFEQNVIDGNKGTSKPKNGPEYAEWRKKLSIANKGNPHSAERRKAIKAGVRRTRTTEQCPHCPRQIRGKSNMVQHIRSKHPTK